MSLHKHEWRRSAHINWLLNLTGRAVEEQAPNGVVPWSKTDLKEFKKAIILFAGNDPDVDIYFANVDWSCLDPGFDVCCCGIGVSGEYPVSFLRIRHARMSELRGIPTFSDKVVMLYQMYINGKSKISTKKYFQYLPNGTWAYVAREGMGTRLIGRDLFMPSSALDLANAEESNALKLGLSVAFSSHYQWKVELMNAEGFSVQLTCHPERIKQLFKLRHKYTDRRKALRHLVTNHWRKFDNDVDFDIATFVRDHLRGQLKFKWFDLHCTVIVPPGLKKDLRKKELQRSLMRMESPRTDRRRLFASAAR